MILGTVTSIFKWYAKRNDNYNSPIIPGMRRTKASERARERILSDDEIRLVWTKATGDGGGKAKAALDAATGITGWTLHDCRRTARSLMSRAGVHPDIAERVLGHVQQGVLGTYDRHAYKEEKREALRMLAGLVESILRNDADKKVRRLRG